MDLSFVIKDADGNVAAMELSDLDEDVAAAFGSMGAGPGMLFNEDDLEAVGEELDPNSSAALLVWENVWATRLAEAIRGAGGEVYDLETIPHDVVMAAVDYAKANAS
jgi:hypothetical protein